MTAEQILSVAAALDTAWQITAIAAWLTSAAALGVVLVWRWEDIREDALCVAAAVPWRRSAGKHHRSGGRHRADRVQHPDPTEKLDSKPVTAPAQPAPTGGTR